MDWIQKHWRVVGIIFICGILYNKIDNTSVKVDNLSQLQTKQWQVMSDMSQKVSQAANDIDWLKRFVEPQITSVSVK